MSASVSIVRLRSAADGAEPVVARLALEALAGELAGVSNGLAPQSVLLLRRMALVVAPGTLARFPDTAARLRFAADAARQMAAAAAKAVRPAQVHAVHDADAVWFSDEAEMLACLARDGLAGRMDRWWWRVILSHAYPHWPSAFARRPNAIPAALRVLTRMGLASEARMALAREGAIPPGLIPASQAATRPGDAAPLPTAIPAPTDGVCPAPGHTERQRSAAAELGTARTLAVTNFPPPSHPTQPPEESDLIGQIAAGHAPRLRPAPEGASREVRSSRAYEGPTSGAIAPSESVLTPADGDDLSGGLKPIDSAAAPAPCRPTAAHSAAPPVPSDTPPIAGHEDIGQARPLRHADGAAASAGPVRATRLDAEVLSLVKGLARPTSAPVSDLQYDGSADRDVSRPPSAEATDAAGEANAEPTSDVIDPYAVATGPLVIDSRFAGVFFLINVLLGDGLYPDFTRRLDPGFPVPLWRLLALLGERLAGSGFRADPLWTLLDRLSDEQPVREGEDIDACWPIPGASRRRPRRRRTDHHNPFEDWLDRYAKFVRSRLAAALALSSGSAGRAVVARPARVYVTAAEIVVVHALQSHPVEIRLAGLDRDPGFLPSVGLSLKFLFQ